jgi:hypothetical protein
MNLRVETSRLKNSNFYNIKQMENNFRIFKNLLKKKTIDFLNTKSYLLKLTQTQCEEKKMPPLFSLTIYICTNN